MTATLGAQLWNRDAASLRKRARDVEELGFAAITVGDHLGQFPPLTACAIVAEATARTQVGPLVLNNDLRHPVVLAHEAAALADLSGGRFELGLGSGYARREYERAGIEFGPREDRAARLGESVQILRGLLAGETVTFTGSHYQVREASVPASPHSAPILVGGNSAAVHAVAARYADIIGLVGFSPIRGGAGSDISDLSVAALERQLARLRELAGDRFSQLQLHALVQWHDVTANRRAAAERASAALEVSIEVALDSPYVLLGTPAEIATQLTEQGERFGISRWTVFADRPDLQSAEALVSVLDLLAEA